jgi:lipopolysaccharide/colanic/teichoic acid biosynthesis glycosyltransferase
MTLSKRFFDMGLALILLVVLLPVLLGLCVLILVIDGRPVFYFNERMQTPTRAFWLVKLRTMRPAATQDSGVSGGDKTNRITRMGGFLRRSRLDETPQLYNILKGEMSFVGPRPPLRQYVQMFPQLYAQVLLSRPGVTGQASLSFHRHEERLLAACKTTQETNDVYIRRCIGRKARLDMIYQKNQSLCLDLRILWRTFADRLYPRA